MMDNEMVASHTYMGNPSHQNTLSKSHVSLQEG
jgi:hypothetical protein